jgi:hypothetical protein
VDCCQKIDSAGFELSLFARPLTRALSPSVAIRVAPALLKGAAMNLFEVLLALVAGFGAGYMVRSYLSYLHHQRRHWQKR